MVNSLIDILFLLYLISGLGAGFWVFYEFLFQRRFLFKEDIFIIDLIEGAKTDFETINGRLDDLEESNRVIIGLLEKKQHETEK